MTAPSARVGTAALWLLPSAALWWVSHRFCLDLGFVGDDFQWWQHARMALERPALLLAAYGGYRPLNTWTMALDHLLHGTAPWGYHLTSLVLHLGCGVALWGCLGRFGVSAPARGAAAALWLCSPLTLEPAQAVCERFEPALLASWLGMAALWPGAGERWGKARAAGVVGLALLTAAAKETWVVLPAFVALFELAIARAPARRALRLGALAAVAALAYTAVYLARPAIEPGTFHTSVLRGALKVPHAWAVFMHLTPLRPMELRLGPAEAVGAVAAVAAAWLAWRWRSAAMAVGLGLFLFPLLPVLPVEWITSRYTFVPYAGFLVVAAAAADEALLRCGRRARPVVAAGVAAAVVAVLVAGVHGLQADAVDARAFSAVHERLVAEARALAPAYPRTGAVVAVRIERAEPLRELSAGVRGSAKTFFVRPADPAGLADWAALLSYALDPLGGPMLAAVEPGRAPAGPFAVVAYAAGGFAVREPLTATVAAEVSAWRAAGRAPRVLVPWSPRRPTPRR